MKRRPSSHHNLLRVLRRRLGLNQRELAYLIGYDSDSQLSRLENGSRFPYLTEVLLIELVFGRASKDIFPGLHRTVTTELKARVKLLKADLEGQQPRRRRVPFKTAQLERVLASLDSLDA